MEPLERLLNLVGLLLETKRPLTFEQIREAMPEAYGGANVDSAKRKFERDKDDLRNYDIPLVMQPVDAWGELGYTIPKDKYYLPEIEFTSEEMAALFIAAQTGDDDQTAERAVRKLLYGAQGGVLTNLSGSPLAAGSASPGSTLLAAADATSRQRRVRFGYRTSVGQASPREVDAFGMVCRGGRWYLVGHDHERNAVRAFRLSRFTTSLQDAGEGSPPPEGFRAAEHVMVGPWGGGDPEERVEVAFSPSVAWWATTGLRNAAVSKRPDGWVVVSVPFEDEAALVDWVLGFGPDAVALRPSTFRDEIVRRLEEALDRA
jgi:proteasome accessory factor B